MFDEDCSSPAMMSEVCGRRQFVDLKPPQLCDGLPWRDVHGSREGQIVEDEMPSLIVPHERFNLCEFQCCIVYSCLFLQDPPRSLLWMLKVMQICDIGY